MTIQVIEVSLADLMLPASTDGICNGFVYEHLKRYCSKFRPLPAVAVTVARDRLLVVDRFQYVSVARDLGDDRIRAVLRGVTLEELQNRNIPGVLRAVPDEVLAQELRDEIVTSWHVFFFKTAPHHDIVIKIDACFRRFLEESLTKVLTSSADLQISSSFDVTGPCLEIRFPTPLTNHQWAASYHAFIVSISRDLCAIETYQGRRFEER
jgi:hypothetical protein